MDSSLNIDEGISLIRQGSVEDRKKNYEEAKKLYQEGIQYLNKALENEVPGDKARDAVQAKCQRFAERVDEIQKYLETKK